MRRVGIAAVLALTILGSAASAVSSEAPLTGSCQPKAFLPGIKLITATPGQYLVVRFRVTSPTSIQIWGQSAGRSRVDGMQSERSLVAFFLEDSNRRLIAQPGGLFGYGYGGELTSGSRTLRLDGPGLCGNSASGGDYNLAPGDYRVVVLGNSDGGSGFGIGLPKNLQITKVSRGSAARISEADLNCPTKSRITLGGVVHERLEDCSMKMQAGFTKYHAIFVDHARDADHRVDLVWPQGPPAYGFREEIAGFGFGIGGRGTFTLDVPRYVTPIGQPLIPLIPGMPTSEGGILGAFTSIPLSA